MTQFDNSIRLYKNNKMWLQSDVDTSKIVDHFISQLCVSLTDSSTKWMKYTKCKQILNMSSETMNVSDFIS